MRKLIGEQHRLDRFFDEFFSGWATAMTSR
jgi:hypothetical protein